jgi:Xaa-Pro dipeptidase
MNTAMQHTKIDALRQDDVPTFSSAERDRRWNIGRQIMEEQDLEALIVFGSREGAFPAPFSMDTFFTNDRPGAIVVFPRNCEPIALVFALAVNDHMQATERKEQVWIRPENMFGGAPNGHALVTVLKKLGLGQGRIGVLGLDPYPPFYFDGPMPYHTWKTVLDNFPKTAFEQVGRRFSELTAARSAEELEILKWSAGVGEKMCEAMLLATKAGVSEADIYAAILEACPRNVGFTAEILLGSGKDFVSWGPPTWNYRPHAPRVIESGDLVMAEVFSSLGMLETQHQPSVAVGKVHPDYQRAADVARASYEAGLDALQPGRTFGEVVNAMQAPLKEAGGYNIHPLIHSINPYGMICGFGEGLTKLPEAKRYALVGQVPMFGAEVEMKPGMTFSVEPSCMFGRRYVNLGGTVVVGKDKPIELNQIATRLMHAG